jgi:sigma-B regulation protein RsbU (phosphoserine phosphatase)
MARVALVAVCIYLVGKSVSSFSPGSIFGVLEDIGFLALLVPAVHYAYRVLIWLKNKVLWKVRNRILISFTFVALFPLLVLGLLVTLALLLTFRTMSGFYLDRELTTVADDLDRATQRVFREYYLERGASSGDLEVLSNSVSSVLADLPSSLQTLRFGIYSNGCLQQKSGEPQGRVGGESDLPDSLPAWLRNGFVDLMVDSSDVAFLSASAVGDFLVVGRMAFDHRVIEYLRRRTSIEIQLAQFTPGQPEFEVESRIFRNAQDFFSVTWVHFYTPTVWNSGESESRVIFLSIPLATLLRYFYDRFTGPGPLILLALIAGLFAFTILTSFVIGATLARSITRSIHNIYVGSRSIQEGDFEFRIPSGDRDQLDAMANSFNRMSASIVGLMKEVSDKERLEKEIEIAKEVQKQLFPQQLPPTKNLELAANCMAARQVSGDYYDFLPSGDTGLDIVVGDISGKGISAALMMASIQASIRSKLRGPLQPEKQTQRMAETVAEVNRQIYHRSSPETYSTLIITHFNSETGLLAYCNAGHHPPLVFSGGEVRGLTIGGTVVGLFENWNYEGDEVELKPGDLVIYFTDGVVEAENINGEQFGTERLIELIRSNTFLTAQDIQSLILEQVFDWTGAQEQADDITVVCLKVLA